MKISPLGEYGESVQGLGSGVGPGFWLIWISSVNFPEPLLLDLSVKWVQSVLQRITVALGRAKLWSTPCTL